jgi:hypothetical protein
MEGSELLLRSSISKSNLPASAVIPESEPATDVWERTVLSLFHSTSVWHELVIEGIQKNSWCIHTKTDIYVEVELEKGTGRKIYLRRRHGRSTYWSPTRVFASFWMVTAVEEECAARHPEKQNSSKFEGVVLCFN